MRFKALGELFTQNKDKLFALALSITKCRASAEDVIHDALLAVAETPNEPDNLLFYLFRTIRNKALHVNKSNYSHEQINESYLSCEQHEGEKKILMDKVASLIEELNQEQQQVIIMKLFADLTFKEIAELTETSLNTIASQYRRGIKIIQEKLNEN